MKKFKEFMLRVGHSLEKNNQAPDHVKELSLDGPDSFDNLWPLAANENIVPDQKVNPDTGKQVKEFKDAGDNGKNINTFKDFMGKHFIIKKFKE